MASPALVSTNARGFWIVSTSRSGSAPIGRRISTTPAAARVEPAWTTKFKINNAKFKINFEFSILNFEFPASVPRRFRDRGEQVGVARQDGLLEIGMVGHRRVAGRDASD